MPFRLRQTVLLFLLFILSQDILFAQSETDSLKLSLKNAAADSNQVKTLNRLAWLLRSTSPDEAMEYGMQANKLAAKIGYDKGRGDSYNYIGIIYYRRGEPAEAIKAHLQALRIRDQIGDKRGTGLSYINLGNVYSDQKNNELALDYYQKAAAIFSELNDQSRLPVLYVNISSIFITQGKNELGLDFCNKARRVAHEIGDSETEALALNNSGVALLSMGKTEAAFAAHQESYSMSEAAGDQNGMIDASINLGKIRRDQKKYSEALDWHFKAEKMALGNGNMEGLRVVYDGISKDYEAMGDYKTALAYHVRFKNISDSLFNDENSSRINDLTARWQNEKRERELAAMTKEIAERDIAEKEASTRLWLISAGSILVLIFAGYMVFAWQRNRRANFLMSVQKDLIERKNEELAVKNKDITDSIIYSRRIQLAMLPAAQKMEQHLKDAFIFYRPRDIVSGDFYWIEPWGNELLVAAGDCTGHGVPGALLSVVGLNLLNQSLQVHGISKPSLILNALNKGMSQTLGQQNGNADPEPFMFSDGMDISLVSIDREKMTASYAGANNPLWILRNGEIIEVPANRLSIGYYLPENPAPFSNHEIDLQKGDMLYLFTDGYADQFGGPSGKNSCTPVSRTCFAIFTIIRRLFRKKYSNVNWTSGKAHSNRWMIYS